MIKRSVGILASSLGLFAISYQAQAWDVNIEVDIKTSTKYANCQRYADNIVDLVKLFSIAENDEIRAYVDNEIKDMKKAKKECEKTEKRNNKKKDKNTKIKVGHKFGEKS